MLVNALVSSLEEVEDRVKIRSDLISAGINEAISVSNICNN